MDIRISLDSLPDFKVPTLILCNSHDPFGSVLDKTAPPEWRVLIKQQILHMVTQRSYGGSYMYLPDKPKGWIR